MIGWNEQLTTFTLCHHKNSMDIKKATMTPITKEWITPFLLMVDGINLTSLSTTMVITLISWIEVNILIHSSSPYYYQEGQAHSQRRLNGFKREFYYSQPAANDYQRFS